MALILLQIANSPGIMGEGHWNGQSPANDRGGYDIGIAVNHADAAKAPSTAGINCGDPPAGALISPPLPIG